MGLVPKSRCSNMGPPFAVGANCKWDEDASGVMQELYDLVPREYTLSVSVSSSCSHEFGSLLFHEVLNGRGWIVAWGSSTTGGLGRRYTLKRAGDDDVQSNFGVRKIQEVGVAE